MSRNLVNGDSLKKYHIGINTPNISEELINENVTSFKVGTSNVNGVDLTNQMEQSLVTLDNIEGRSVREDVDDDYTKIINCITLGDLELKSLPNGTKDTYSNGVYTKKINRVYFKDLNWSHFSDGATGTKTTIYKANIPNMTTCGDANSNNYNFICSRYDLVSANTQWVVDDEYMSMYPSNKGVYLRISKASIPNASDINQYLGFHYIDYELENPIEEVRELNFLCKPNDIIDTKSPIPFTCSHTVQLNTKAQVEETQKQIVKSNKSIWQKFKELTEKFKEFTDVEMKLEEHGYIKFPTAFGGLILQWGSFHIVGTNDVNWFGQDVMFPKPMSKLFTIQCSVDSLRTWDASKGVKAFVERENTSTIGTKFITYVPDNTSTTLRWFVIGR